MSEETPITDGATFEVLSTLQSGTIKVVRAELAQRFEQELAVERAKYKAACEAFNKKIASVESELEQSW